MVSWYFISHMTGKLRQVADDLPIIRDNIKKGFLETQSKVNSWVTNLKKKLDGEDEDDFGGRPLPPASGYNNVPPRQPSYGKRSGDYSRRSADHERYDADPQVLGDDFTGLQLKDAEGKKSLYICNQCISAHKSKLLSDAQTVPLPIRTSSNRLLHDLCQATADEFRFKMVRLKKLGSSSAQLPHQIRPRDHHQVPVVNPVSGSHLLLLIQTQSETTTPLA